MIEQAARITRDATAPRTPKARSESSGGSHPIHQHSGHALHTIVRGVSGQISNGFIGPIQFETQQCAGPLNIRSLIARKDHDAGVVPDSLQKVVDLHIRIAIVAVFHFAALAEQRVSLIEEQNRLAARRCFEDRRQVLLVSPMYLLTSALVSTRITFTPSSRASISAAMVLPAPLGPVNRTTFLLLAVWPGPLPGR